MNRIATLACLLLLAPALDAHASAIVGKPAPALEARDADGKTVRLDAYKGKYVVLEWVNRQCPFVRKHYGSGNMQSLQKKYTEKGVVVTLSYLTRIRTLPLLNSKPSSLRAI